MSKSFCERLVESFESRPDKTAMRIVGSDAATYTFGELHRQMVSVAYQLTQHQIGKGDRVALLGENHPKWAVAYLGTVFNASVIVPMDPHGEIETLTNFVENSEAKLAFLSPDQTSRFDEIQERLGRKVPSVVWSLNGKGAAVAGHGSFEEWAATDVPANFAERTPPARDKDMALLMYTSGTTGTPKGVPLTHANILAELEGVNYVLHLTDQEKILSLLPLFHAYLQIVNLWIATTYGCEVGYLKELTPAELSEAMKEFKPTILTTVPRLWYLFHKKIFDAVKARSSAAQAAFKAMLSLNGALRAVGINLGHTFFKPVHESFGGHLKKAISAGSRFDEDVAIDFHNLGFTILQGYGLTETSGAATATYEADNRVGSVGKAMHGAEIKIAELDKDGVGEVLIKGPMVFDGYYQNPTATAEAFTHDGWFRSGDLGKLVDGHLYIVGRGKDVIVLPSGKNVHPEDLEVHYLKCPLVAELAIIGVEDESESRAGAEKLAAIVVPDFDYLKKEKIANSKEAIRHALDTLGRSLPEYQRVRDYIVRAEPLPRTATRKIKRFQLKQELESGAIAVEGREQKTWELSPADETALQTPVAEIVISAIRQNARDADVIHPDMNLEIDLGLDSLARAETFAALEQAYSTEFDTEEAATALTVANVIDLVNKHGGAEADNVAVELNWGKIVREVDDDIPEVQGVLRDRPVFAAFAWSIYKAFNLFCRVFMRLEVRGLEHINSLERPFIICPNHQSFLDPFVLCSNYRYDLFKNIFHVGASEFFSNSFMRWLAKLLNVVPVDPDTQLMKAMKAGAIGLKHGRVLNIYPEGERAFDGRLHGFKKGAAILAYELDLQIVPVALDGLYKVWPRNSWRIRPAKVKIHIGEPVNTRELLAQRGTGQHPEKVIAAAAAPGAQIVHSSESSIRGDEKYEIITAGVKQIIAAMIDDMRT
ncbi:MAG: AMP-binding protein [Acidobacteria bacterium]|nr:AMP-binding protein [Acidobacteriota bacterium]